MEVLSSTLPFWVLKVRVVFENNLPGTRKLRSVRALVVNVVTNKVARLLGKDETVRWMNLAIYQGQPSKKSLNTVVSMAGIPACFPNSFDVS